MMLAASTFPSSSGDDRIVEAFRMSSDDFKVYVLTIRSTLAPARLKDVTIFGEFLEFFIGFFDLCKQLRIYIFGKCELESFHLTFKGGIVVPKDLPN